MRHTGDVFLLYPLTYAVAEAALSSHEASGINERHERFIQALQDIDEKISGLRAGTLYGTAAWRGAGIELQGRVRNFLHAAVLERRMILNVSHDVISFSLSLEVVFADIDEGLTWFEKPWRM
ncbi:MAG: Succinylornithine transaminase/acetylornithine aminotransferase [Sodalis sp.]|uniref:hypothetical protein n=1 Tax=Sodalis sp. (in: enterobacteria) TaxID=1898979 RepID=UPI003873549C|nr:MAG: Succinylornithine transaminase/acetylornithine aminotransferase [Sodalis sp.]